MSRNINYLTPIIFCILFQLTQATCLNKIIHSVTKGNHYNLFLNKPEKLNPENLTHFSIDLQQLENFLTKLDFKLSSYTIFLDENISLNDTLATIVAEEAFSSYARFVILTQNPNEVQIIAQTLWQYKLLKSFTVLHQDQKVKEVFKIRLVNCEEAKAEEMRLNFKDEDCEFEGVVTNLKKVMKGCPIYIITGLEPPLVNPENSTLKGLFLEMMDVFSTASDRTLVYRPYDSVYMDEIVEAYSFESMIESFESGYADLFMGATQITSMPVMDIGPLLISNDLLFVVPRDLISDVIDLTSPKGSAHLVAFWSIMTVFMVFCFRCFTKWTEDKLLFGDLGKTLMMVFGITLNVPLINKTPKNRIVMTCLCGIVWCAFIFSTYLQGALISIVNGPTYEPPITNLKGLIDKGTPIVLNAPMAMFFNYLNMPYFKAVYEKHIFMQEKDLFDNVHVLLVKRNFATVIYKSFLIMKPNLEKSFSIFYLWANAHVPTMPKNYYMHEEFCNWFQQMVEFGIIQKFWRLYEFYYAQDNFVHVMSRTYRVTLEMFLPVMALWVSGCGLAICCFIFEVLVYHLSRLFR